MTIRTNTTNNTAIFMFESVISQQTYVCHFFAEDGKNWIKTAMTWEQLALKSDIGNDILTLDTKYTKEISDIKVTLVALSAEIEQLKNSIK